MGKFLKILAETGEVFFFFEFLAYLKRGQNFNNLRALLFSSVLTTRLLSRRFVRAKIIDKRYP